MVRGGLGLCLGLGFIYYYNVLRITSAILNTYVKLLKVDTEILHSTAYLLTMWAMPRINVPVRT